MRTKAAALTLTVLLAGAGCSKHSTAGQPLPADYRITQSIAILVEANKAATETVIQLNKTAVIDDATTTLILSYTAAVAQASKASLAILDANATTEQKTAQIQAAFAQITSSAGIQAYINAHQNDPSAKAVVAALQTIEVLMEGLVKGVNQ